MLTDGRMNGQTNVEKASGILLSPPSVLLSPPKQLDRIQPNLVSGLLTQVGHARACLFLAPPPGALGRGQKRSNINNFQFQSQF